MYFYLYIALSDILHFYGNHQDKLVSNIFNYAILPTRWLVLITENCVGSLKLTAFCLRFQIRKTAFLIIKLSSTKEEVMSVNKHDSTSYWKANVRIITICLVVWALCSYGFGIVLRPLLAGIHIGGTDLGFWFAQQGSILTFIAIIFFYSWRMNKLDEEFGVHEE